MRARLGLGGSASFQRTLIRATLLPALLLVVLIGVFLWQLSTLLNATRLIEHSDQVIAKTNTVLEQMIDQETGLRGYLLTGNENFLDPYTRAASQIGSELTQLRQLVADNPEHLQRLAAIDAAYEAWQSYATRVKTLKDQNGPYADMVAEGRGKQQMDAIRSQIAALLADEAQRRDERSRGSQETTRLVVLISILTALTLGAILAILIASELLALSRRYEQAITEIETRTEEAETQREWFRGTLASIGDGVIATDPDGNVTFINPVAQELTGWPESDARGVPLPNVLTLINEETRQQVDNPALRALHEGTMIGMANHTLLIRRDGTETPIDDSAAPIRDGDEEIVGAVLVFRDISERRAAEDALRESEAQFHQLAEAMPQMVWLSDATGKAEYYNQRWYDFTGLTLEQTQAQGWRGLTHPDDYAQATALWKATFAAGEPYSNETRLMDGATGAFSWFLVRAVPLHDDDGNIYCWIGTCTNIDEQKRAVENLQARTEELTETAEQLEDRNRELDQFAYVTSHDLKAPLRGIANLAQWVEEDLGDAITDDVRGHLELMRGRVHRMESLIDGLLQYSRVGRVKTVDEEVNVAELIEEVQDMLAPPPGIHVTVAPDMPTIITDRLLLRQVFQNLISNAIKHHQSAVGMIAVEVSNAGRYYQFSVKDDGPGIAPQYHEKIFGIFQTLAPRDAVESSGLGLALVRKIVERHGGHVWVESAEGAGATFSFTWPKRM